MTGVYALWNEGLGDHVASISLLAQMARARSLIRFHSKPVHRRRHEELLKLLVGADVLAPTDEPATEHLDGFNVWATEYLPTHARWSRCHAAPTICTHFEGISSAREKNPPPADVQQITEWAAKRGLRVSPLTGQMPLAEVVRRLATCSLFVGCDSGMSHLAHCVGTPTYLLEYGLPVVTCHRHKAYVRCDGAGHFIAQAANWMGYLDCLL